MRGCLPAWHGRCAAHGRWRPRLPAKRAVHARWCVTCLVAAGLQFGLRAREIVAVVNRLAEEGMLDCLNLLHFHVGSQITNIRM